MANPTTVDGIKGGSCEQWKWRNKRKGR